MKWLMVFCLIASSLNAAAEDVEVLTVDGNSFRGYGYRDGATKTFELMGVGQLPGTEVFLRQLIGGKTVDVKMRGQYAIVSAGGKLVNLEVIKSGYGLYDPKRGDWKVLQEAHDAARHDKLGHWPEIELELERRRIAGLGKMRDSARESVPLLLEAFHKKGLRRNVIQALGEIGPDAAPAVPVLVEALSSELDREAAIVALGKIGPGAVEATPRLLQLLENRDMRFQTMIALGRIGPIPVDYVPLLLKMIDTNDVLLRRQQLIDNCRVSRSQEVVPELIQLWKERRGKEQADPVQAFCEESLVRVGKPSVPALIEAIHDQDVSLRLDAILILSRIGSDAKAAVQPLLRLARQDAPNVKAAAINALISIDPDGIETTCLLLDLVEQSDQEMHYIVNEKTLLDTVGPEDKELIPILTDKLDSESFRLRMLSALLLGNIGPQAHDSIPTLKKLLRKEIESKTLPGDKSHFYFGLSQHCGRCLMSPTIVPLDAIKRIGGNKQLLPILVDLQLLSMVVDFLSMQKNLREEDKSVYVFTIDFTFLPDELTDADWDQLSDLYRNGSVENRCAIISLIPLYPSDEAARIINQAISDTNKDIQAAAVRAARDAPRLAAESVPELVALLKDETLRYDAVRVMEAVGPEAGQAVPALIELLGARSHNTIDIVKTLGAIGPNAKDAIPALIDTLCDGRHVGNQNHKDLTRHVVLAIETISTDKVSIVSRLGDALTDPSERVRIVAARSLSFLGDQSEGAVGALTTALRDPNWEVREYAADALGNIGAGAASAVPALIESLRDETVGGNLHVAVALGKIGPKARLAVPGLIEALGSPHLGTSHRAGESLVKLLQPDDQDSIVPLVETLLDPRESENQIIQFRILRALRQIDGGLEQAVDAAIDQLEAPQQEARLEAARALTQIGGSADNAVAVLTTALEDENTMIRIQAAKALGSIGSPAKPAIEALKEGLSEPILQEVYSIAIERIDPLAITPAK